MQHHILHKNMMQSQIFPETLRNHNVIDRIKEVPRYMFFQGIWKDLCYTDLDIKICESPPRYELRPFAISHMLNILETKQQVDSSVLVVGASTGYVPSLLAGCFSHVYVIDSCPDIVQKATQNISDAGLSQNISIIHTDTMRNGYDSYAPYDSIFFNGAIEELPQIFSTQLRHLGQIITLKKYGNICSCLDMRKIHDRLSSRTIIDCDAHIIPEFHLEKQFTF